MEEKLEKYRAKLRREAFFNKFKKRLINMVTFTPTNDRKKDDETIDIPDEKLEEHSESENESIGVNNTSSEDDEANAHPIENQANKESSKLKYFTYFIWFCFWATCWMIAVELKFGIVFLLFSALFGIYFNTRTGPKQRNEVSAYSVFNENCESIDGTLKAEQFEREIRYGPMTVHK